MEKAKVAIFEDNEIVRDTYLLHLQRVGHQVVVTAGSVEEAIASIDLLERGDIDVAMLDGNLTRGKDDCSEGALIAGMLREKMGESVSILSISGTNQKIEGADKRFDKEDFRGIREYIAEL